MPDYDFKGLSARSFEQMIQALACKVIGPGIVIFGDGPDGGREATFKGKLPAFPSAGKSWNGYLVVQAKFCQRPKGKPNEDGKWALEQLRKELEVFGKRDTKRKRPQFYIFATNVVLTAAQRTGGKDKLSRLLDEYKKKIGLKDYRIWDYDQLCRFLDGDEHVRRCHGAWITPGDVLAQLAAAIDRNAPDFSKVMLNFLQKETLDDHFSKLEQAGHSPENRIPLERVFVDLPAFKDRRSEAPEEEKDLPPGLLAEMLSLGSTCLRPEGPSFFGSKENLEQQMEKEELGRFVLVGGPGQGKSTLAQFLCQIHRANLLRDKRGLDAEVREVVKSIATHCSSQELPLAIARRFPLRLELARFAKTLGSHTETGIASVLSYVAYVVKDRTGHSVAVDDLRRWLETYPWLVILDGLDEVPASSNRVQVLVAIRDFLVDVASSNGDVLVLATTRPQGYNEEFSPQRYQHRWLAPLSIPRALHYGQTLVEITYLNNVQRKKEVLARLRSAATVPATARLMESPLQVTIMTRLLAQVAQPPQERYRLFQQYYKVIYRREMERGVEVLSQLLREHEANVDSIHRRTGLLLQMESERTRHTDATITMDDFKVVVTDRLRDEGYSGDDLEKLADAIATCATDRLVFLVPSLSERVGFDIRSLQEFMAAEALMDGPDALVVERLRKVASVPFWQNVLLFAAGKCFAERQWLRDCVSQVCAELNDDPGDSLAQHTLAGSQMALSLLEDGSARQQPAFAQSLMRRALMLLDLPAERNHKRLVAVFEPSFEKVYREELVRRLEGGNPLRGLAGWVVIAELAAGRGVAWAQEMAEKYWPKNPNDLYDLLRILEIDRNSWVGERYAKAFFEVPSLFRPHWPHDRDNISEILKSNKLASDFVDCWSWLWRSRTDYRSIAMISMEGLAINVVRLSESRELLSPFATLEEGVHKYWKPLKAAACVAQQPSVDNVAQALDVVAETGIFSARDWIYAPVLPWPMLACLCAARSLEEIKELASRMRRREMGEPADWEKAEARWRSKGIAKNDLAHMTDERWPIPGDIAEIGFPFACLRYGGFMQYGPASWESLVTFWHTLPGDRARSLFAGFFLHMICPGSPLAEKARSSADAVKIMTDVIRSLDTDIFPLGETVSFIFSVLTEGTDAANALEHLGRLLSANQLLHAESSKERSALQEVARFSAKWLEREPSRHGLANLLALLAATVQIDHLPSCLRDLSMSSNARTASAAAVLQLVQRGLRAETMHQIAQDVLNKCDSDQTRIMTAIEIYRNHQMENPDGSQFLQKLLESLPLSFIEARRRLIAILTELLARRVTLLSERQVWERLELPTGLFNLLNR